MYLNLKMTLFDTEMTLEVNIFFNPVYQKCYVTVIIDYFKVSCCSSAAHSEINNFVYTVAEFESENIDIVTLK